MSAEEKRLRHLFRSLSEGGRQSLLDYAEFLASRDPGMVAAAPAEEPLDIPRPSEESVVKAIRRLMVTYPMLDRDKLLHETSSLMARHVVHKHPAAEVIDELEGVFKRYYEVYRQAKN